MFFGDMLQQNGNVRKIELSWFSRHRLTGPRSVWSAWLSDVLVGPLSSVAETGVDRDELVSGVLEPSGGVWNNVEGGGGDHRVGEHHVWLRRTVDDAVHDSLGELDGSTRGVLGVFGPEEELLVAPLAEDLQYEVVVRAVRRSEVQWLHTEDPDEGSLKLLELLVDTVVVESGQVRVGPSMRAESVALSVESSDLVDPVIDTDIVVSVQEEGSLAAVQAVDNILLVLEWSVIKGQSDLTRVVAVVDDLNSVLSLFEGSSPSDREQG